MPGVTLHFVIADRTLQRWRHMDGGTPPFDPEDPAALNAYFHGAVGPDLGYFPGGHRLLSDLAHCVRTGVLARQLLRGANTVRERAFALGWLTHVLADQAIHPWIGRGVGELLTGARDRFVDGSSNLLAHLRVEMGVDAWYAERHPSVRRRRLAVAFRPHEMGFLVRAYAAAYGVAIARTLFVRSHRATSRRVGQALATLPMVQALMASGGTTLPPIRWALRAAYRCERLRSAMLAYLNPVVPTPWLLDAIGAEVVRHTDVFARHARDGARELDDFNLDTGVPLALETDHPGTRRALDGLAELARSHGSESVRPPEPEPRRAASPLGIPARPIEA